MDVMVAEISSVEVEERNHVETSDHLGLAVGVFLIAVIGAGIVAAFWWAWHAVMGSIPTFWGVSRIWLDSISGACFAVIIVAYVVVYLEKNDELSIKRGHNVSFGEFRDEHMAFNLLGLVIIVSIIISSLWTFAIGLFITAFAGVCYGFWTVVQVIIFVGYKFSESFAGYDNSDEN